MKLTLQYWKTVIQILSFGLSLTVLVGVAMAVTTKEKGKIEALFYDNSTAEFTTGEYDAKRAKHDMVSTSQKELKTYFEGEFNIVTASCYHAVASGFRMAERHWRNSTVKAYIHWQSWSIVSFLLVVILLLIYRRLDKKLVNATEDEKRKGAKIAADGDGTLLSGEVRLMVFGIIGLMTFGVIVHAPILLCHLGTLVALIIKSLSFVSQGGNILPSRETIRGESDRLAKTVRGTFNIRENGKKNIGRPKPQSRAKDGKLAPPPSMDILLGGKNDE